MLIPRVVRAGLGSRLGNRHLITRVFFPHQKLAHIDISSRVQSTCKMKKKLSGCSGQPKYKFCWPFWLHNNTYDSLLRFIDQLNQNDLLKVSLVGHLTNWLEKGQWPVLILYSAHGVQYKYCEVPIIAFPLISKNLLEMGTYSAIIGWWVFFFLSAKATCSDLINN